MLRCTPAAVLGELHLIRHGPEVREEKRRLWAGLRDGLEWQVRQEVPTAQEDTLSDAGHPFRWLRAQNRRQDGGVLVRERVEAVAADDDVRHVQGRAVGPGNAQLRPTRVPGLADTWQRASRVRDGRGPRPIRVLEQRHTTGGRRAAHLRRTVLELDGALLHQSEACVLENLGVTRQQTKPAFISATDVGHHDPDLVILFFSKKSILSLEKKDNFLYFYINYGFFFTNQETFIVSSTESSSRTQNQETSCGNWPTVRMQQLWLCLKKKKRFFFG